LRVVSADVSEVGSICGKLDQNGESVVCVAMLAHELKRCASAKAPSTKLLIGLVVLCSANGDQDFLCSTSHRAADSGLEVQGSISGQQSTRKASWKWFAGSK